MIIDEINTIIGVKIYCKPGDPIYNVEPKRLTSIAIEIKMMYVFILVRLLPIKLIINTVYLMHYNVLAKLRFNAV